MDQEYDIRLIIDGQIYEGNRIVSYRTENSLCRDNFEIGVAACASMELKIRAPTVEFARMASIIREVRPRDNPSAQWQKRGQYFINTRKTVPGVGFDVMEIKAFDGMRKTGREIDFTEITFPADSKAVVQHIAQQRGLEIAPGTLDALTDGVTVPDPDGYTGREILGYIAAMHGGSFRMDDEGRLQFVDLAALLADSNKGFLINQVGACITFGGVRIRV